MKKTIKDLDIKGKKVIIRCDLNVPIKDGSILDDNRIIESLPTIKYALDNNAKIIILSHLGRVKTEEDKIGKSLLPVSKRLSELLNKEVKFIKDTRSDNLTNEVNNMKEKDIILIENTRYEDVNESLESKNNEDLAKYWASLGEVFINDAFGTLHRSHASNVGIASILPSAVGFLVEKELIMLDSCVNVEERPFVVIMGGAKVHDKINIIDSLIKKADYLIVGGGIANTFLKAMGFDLKKSLVDLESIDYCNNLLSKYSDKIILPLDGYSSSEYKDGLEVSYNELDNIKENQMILDVGPKSIEKFKPILEKAKLVFLNGPLGVSEFKNFEYGTKELLKILDNIDAKVVIGGGDSAAAAIRFGYKNSFEHISTGGGASLELIEGKELPGIKVIENK